MNEMNLPTARNTARRGLRIRQDLKALGLFEPDERSEMIQQAASFLLTNGHAKEWDYAVKAYS